jgi:hypothetical protein
MFSIRPENSALSSAFRAALARKKPMKPSQIPDTALSAASHRVGAERHHGIAAEAPERGREPRGAVAVARDFQAIARAIRPPSSGNAGIRLKASSSTLIEVR